MPILRQSVIDASTPSPPSAVPPHLPSDSSVTTTSSDSQTDAAAAASPPRSRTRANDPVAEYPKAALKRRGGGDPRVVGPRKDTDEASMVVICDGRCQTVPSCRGCTARCHQPVAKTVPPIAKQKTVQFQTPPRHDIDSKGQKQTQPAETPRKSDSMQTTLWTDANTSCEDYFSTSAGTRAKVSQLDYYNSSAGTRTKPTPLDYSDSSAGIRTKVPPLDYYTSSAGTRVKATPPDHCYNSSAGTRTKVPPPDYYPSTAGTRVKVAPLDHYYNSSAGTRTKVSQHLHGQTEKGVRRPSSNTTRPDAKRGEPRGRIPLESPRRSSHATATATATATARARAQVVRPQRSAFSSTRSASYSDDRTDSARRKLHSANVPLQNHGVQQQNDVLSLSRAARPVNRAAHRTKHPVGGELTDEHRRKPVVQHSALAHYSSHHMDATSAARTRHNHRKPHHLVPPDETKDYRATTSDARPKTAEPRDGRNGIRKKSTQAAVNGDVTADKVADSGERPKTIGTLESRKRIPPAADKQRGLHNDARYGQSLSPASGRHSLSPPTHSEERTTFLSHRATTDLTQDYFSSSVQASSTVVQRCSLCRQYGHSSRTCTTSGDGDYCKCCKKANGRHHAQCPLGAVTNKMPRTQSATSDYFSERRTHEGDDHIPSVRATKKQQRLPVSIPHSPDVQMAPPPSVASPKEQEPVDSSAHESKNTISRHRVPLKKTHGPADLPVFAGSPLTSPLCSVRVARPVRFALHEPEKDSPVSNPTAHELQNGSSVEAVNVLEKEDSVNEKSARTKPVEARKLPSKEKGNDGSTRVSAKQRPGHPRTNTAQDKATESQKKKASSKASTTRKKIRHMLRLSPPRS